MTEISKELGMFIEYARKHGVDIQVVKSDNPDTFEKIFGGECENAISREAVLDLVADYDLSMGQVVRGIHALPSVQPKQGWTPISESLPNIEKYVDFYKCLVAVNYTSHHNICDSVIAYFDGKHFFRNVHDRVFISGVKAWMPLPEPYKTENEE